MSEVVIPVLAMMGVVALFAFLIYRGNQRHKLYRAELEAAAQAHGLTMTEVSGSPRGFEFHHADSGMRISIALPVRRKSSNSPGSTVMRAPLRGWGNDLLIVPSAEERPVLTQGLGQLQQGGLMAGIARAGLSLAFGKELVPYLTRLEPLDSPIGTVMATLRALPPDLDLTPIDRFQSLPWGGSAPAVLLLGGEVMVRVRGYLEKPGDPDRFMSGVLDLMQDLQS